MKCVTLFVAITICVISVSGMALAQGLPYGTGLELTLSSDNPAPGQEVLITAQSYNTNINSATVTWTVDGKVVKKGVGETKLTVIAPIQGKKLSVNVSAVATDGTVHKGTLSIGSGSVDLILETNGYVHPFFKGKLPAVYQNALTVIAVPHISNSAGVEYAPNNLVYQWKRNNQVLQDQSGYGKQSITLQGDIVPRPFSLFVSIYPRDNTAQTSALINIDFQSPEINFYQNDPLYGTLFNKALSEVVRIGSEKEIGVLAVPFGFNKPVNTIGNLLLNWKINGTSHADLATNESIILRAPSNSAGSSDINLSIRHSEYILQGADGSFSAYFSASKPETVEAPSF